MNRQDQKIAKAIFNNFKIFALGLIFGIIAFVVMGDNATILIVFAILLNLTFILSVELVKQINRNSRNLAYRNLIGKAFLKN